MAPAVVNRPAVERDAPTGVHPVSTVVEDWGRLYGIVAGTELREIGVCLLRTKWSSHRRGAFHVYVSLDGPQRVTAMSIHRTQK